MRIKTLNIEGMSCGHCETRVRKALENVDGVCEAVVSHERKTAVVTLDKDVPNEILKQSVESGLSGAGYCVKKIHFNCIFT